VDANLVIYSVTDRVSFQYAQSCLQELRPAKRHNVVILVANKQDIVRNRVISEEGQLEKRFFNPSLSERRQRSGFCVADMLNVLFSFCYAQLQP
jgi:GTPase SAR1 family protein